MLLPGIILMGAGLLLILYTHYSREANLPAGVRRSRGMVLGVNPAHITGQFNAGLETINFTFPIATAPTFFPGQQVFVDFKPENPTQPIQVLSVREVLGRKFSQTAIAVLLIIAGGLLLRLG